MWLGNVVSGTVCKQTVARQQIANPIQGHGRVALSGSDCKWVPLYAVNPLLLILN
jgi:hypothetical protein